MTLQLTSVNGVLSGVVANGARRGAQTLRAGGNDRTGGGSPDTSDQAQGMDREAAELMQRVRMGDVRAFDRIVDRFWDEVATYSIHLSRNHDLAYDVTQEAFARLWQCRGSWTQSGSVRGWLLRTSRNLIISEQRRWKVRSVWAKRVEMESFHHGPSPLDDTEIGEVRDAISRAIQALSPRRREAFILFHVRDLSCKEVAHIMDVRPQTVANYLQAALADLRKSLGQHFPVIRHDSHSQPSSQGRTE